MIPKLKSEVKKERKKNRTPVSNIIHINAQSYWIHNNWSSWFNYTITLPQICLCMLLSPLGKLNHYQKQDKKLMLQIPLSRWNSIKVKLAFDDYSPLSKVFIKSSLVRMISLLFSFLGKKHKTSLGLISFSSK